LVAARALRVSHRVNARGHCRRLDPNESLPHRRRDNAHSMTTTRPLYSAPELVLDRQELAAAGGIALSVALGGLAWAALFLVLAFR